MEPDEGISSARLRRPAPKPDGGSARGEACHLYTRVFELASPYGDYLQPPFDEATNLTPIDWVLTISSVGLGAFLLSFLKQLGKKSADEVLATLKKIREAPHPKEAETMILEMWADEVLPVAHEADVAVFTTAINDSIYSVRVSLSSIGFPDESAETLAYEIAAEVKRAIERHLERDSQTD